MEEFNSKLSQHALGIRASLAKLRRKEEQKEGAKKQDQILDEKEVCCEAAGRRLEDVPASWPAPRAADGARPGFGCRVPRLRSAPRVGGAVPPCVEMWPP